MVLFNLEPGDKWVHNIPENISQEANVKVLLEFELAYYDVTDTHSHCPQ